MAPTKKMRVIHSRYEVSRRSTDVAPLHAGGSMSAHASMTGTSRPDFCMPKRDRRPTVMHRIAMSAAPDTGEIPATIARGARNAIRIEITTA